MGYYYYPRKQKSKRTIDKNEVLKNSKLIVSHNKLQQLNDNDLIKQKKRYQSELDKLKKEFSIETIFSKIDWQKDYISQINEIRKNIQTEANRLKISLSNIKTYYIEDAWFYPTNLVIQQYYLGNKPDKIIKLEAEIFKILESKSYNNMNNYFYELIEYIKKNFLLFDLNLFENNKLSGDGLIQYISSFNFSQNPGLTFQNSLDEILNIEPKGEGGYYYTLDYSFDEFRKIDKVPTYGELELGSWKKSFKNFKKCNKSDHKSAEVILRFDETNYKNLANRYYDHKKFVEKINNGFYSSQGAVIKKEFYKKYFARLKDALEKNLRKIELIQRSRTKKYEKETNIGYIYILKSDGYPGMYKVGSTYGLPEERAEELSGTNVPDPWLVTGKYKIKNAEYYEKQSHKLMEKYRYRKDREFFKIDLNKIKQVIKYISEISSKGENKLKLNEVKKNFIKDF